MKFRTQGHSPGWEETAIERERITFEPRMDVVQRRNRFYLHSGYLIKFAGHMGSSGPVSMHSPSPVIRACPRGLVSSMGDLSL